MLKTRSKISTKLDNAVLIEKVRQHPELYDPSNRQYFIVENKHKTWKEIAKELGITSEDAKRRWGTLRDTYRKYVKRIEYNLGDINCKYASQLSFLKPITLKRGFRNENKSILNDNNDEEFDEINSSENNLDSFEPEIKSENVQSGDEIPLNKKSFIVNTGKRKQHQITRENRKIPIFIKRKKIDSANKHFDSSHQTRWKVGINDSSFLKSQNRTSNTNNVDVFLAGIAPSLKSLSPIYLNLAKSKIFTIVQHYEMKAILDKSDHSISKKKLKILQSQICKEASDLDSDNLRESLEIEESLITNDESEKITETTDPLHLLANSQELNDDVEDDETSDSSLEQETKVFPTLTNSS